MIMMHFNNNHNNNFSPEDSLVNWLLLVKLINTPTCMRSCIGGAGLRTKLSTHSVDNKLYKNLFFLIISPQLICIVIFELTNFKQTHRWHKDSCILRELPTNQNTSLEHYFLLLLKFGVRKGLVKQSAKL